jgi:hypothetical protein
VRGAVAGEGLTFPGAPALAQSHPSEPRHQVELGRPYVAKWRGEDLELAVDDPVVILPWGRRPGRSCAPAVPWRLRPSLVSTWSPRPLHATCPFRLEHHRAGDPGRRTASGGPMRAAWHALLGLGALISSGAPVAPGGPHRGRRRPDASRARRGEQRAGVCPAAKGPRRALPLGTATGFSAVGAKSALRRLPLAGNAQGDKGRGPERPRKDEWHPPPADRGRPLPGPRSGALPGR